ncbi:xylose isomerase-like protein [Annulohypoxylon maeteangense]|uniref:xylose isomerase-like protein n=1 Tax=Annulohypoxylon maeteangense TaxID=1927788 RepID=UPI002007B2F0|nr:xylose isomerase-like protein [Annulohypoxylon maeteangense]KAI0881387.1 xylose isomerase-like protein [Annulohypoxylon maeteangense]
MPCKLAITSMSLGRCSAGHSLVHKLDMACLYGYRGIELFYEDLLDIAQQVPGNSTTDKELEAAHIIRRLCQERRLAIVCLQPFAHYEGLLDRQAHGGRIEQLLFWFQLAIALGTDMVQIPSNFLPSSELSEDSRVAVEDLREVADLGLQQKPPIRFVYEALCWGTRCNLWEQSWDIVQAVDRPNFGLCLDTFNIAGRIYADPSSPTGRTPNCDQAVEGSIAHLIATIDIQKVFYVQVVDAERLTEPLIQGHEFYNADQPARMSWSRNCRLFYGEKDRGAYLPVIEISRAIFHGLGFEGWVSMELFNRRMSDEDEAVPHELASRGAVAWMKLVKDMKLRIDTPTPERIVVASL